jgi:DNA adenine methylase
MHYPGSKQRLAKHILPIILQNRTPSQTYVEPFVGGCGTMQFVDGKRIGTDANRYLIAMLLALRCGWIPPQTLSREEYHAIKDSPDNYHPRIVGFAMICCSFGTKWRGGYAHSPKEKTNYAARASKQCVELGQKIKDVHFRTSNYLELLIPKNSLIYCDPPYSTQVSNPYQNKKFNHVQFWEWCREKAKEGHTVYVSERTAPDFARIVFENIVTGQMCKNKKQGMIERLFKVRTDC